MNKRFITVIISFTLVACSSGGGGGGGPAPTITSSTVSWASDHITKTTTNTYSNGTTSSSTEIVQPTVTLDATAAYYPTNWTTTGVIIKPSVTNYVETYGDGYVASRTGSTASPFTSASLYAKGVYDPNAAVKTATSSIFDLTWGTPDTSGPTYSGWYNTGSATYSARYIMNRIVSGQCANGATLGYCSNGFTVGAPHPEVTDAWNKGWTGKGVNILMIDSFSSGSTHGVVTTLLAARYAIGANVYGTSMLLNTAETLPGDSIRNFSGTISFGSTPSTKIGVINMSFGVNHWAVSGHSGPFTATELSTNNVDPYYVKRANIWSDVADGSIYWNGFVMTDAVITKSAGNDTVTAENELYSKTLAYNAAVAPRLLIVGALTQAGFTNTPATIASYSNTAGTDAKIQSRFLVASGTTPFSDGDLAVDGVAVTASGNEGTSYAAPRVAGYVAIVRQKFPNLTGAKTADLMLQTARYDTLSCYYTTAGCSKAIYGQGEVSLSRALAPVGYLK